jgi:DNA-binding response OmpR family regulator
MDSKLLLLKNKTVLFAEDDVIARREMSDILKMLFAHLLVASDGEEALRLYEEETPDILITDIKMPKRDGISLIRCIRQADYTLPIILITSYAERDLLINAANLSIDGYLVKPINLTTLTEALGRAFQRIPQSDALIPLADGVYFNAATKELFQKGETVLLGIKELELLQLLVENRNRTVTKEEISRTLWPLDPICDSAIKNIIMRLRKKISTDCIVSVRGIGYRLNTDQTPV